MSSLLIYISNIRFSQTYNHFYRIVLWLYESLLIHFFLRSDRSLLSAAKCIIPCPPGLEICEPIGILGVIVQSLADDILESFVKAESLGNEVIASG